MYVHIHMYIYTIYKQTYIVSLMVRFLFLFMFGLLVFSVHMIDRLPY